MTVTSLLMMKVCQIKMIPAVRNIFMMNQAIWIQLSNTDIATGREIIQQVTIILLNKK